MRRALGRRRGCAAARLSKVKEQGLHKVHTQGTQLYTGGGCYLQVPCACLEIEMRQGGRTACPHTCVCDITARLNKRPTRQRAALELHL